MSPEQNNIIAGFPTTEKLEELYRGIDLPVYRKVNGHIHTPYSFSAFPDIDTAFSMAREEGIAALGINDFFVTDGYNSFYRGAISNTVFPLFNIEFIGLMKEQQKKGIRINDPNNPGRIYFCGKGLDFPFHLSKSKVKTVGSVKEETQNQLRAMISRLNELLRPIAPDMSLDFNEIKRRFARELVRERHLAKAVRVLAEEKFESPEARRRFYFSLFGNTDPRSSLDNHASLENEIRSRLLKAGGAAFVEEDERSFLSIEKIIEIITDSGGIPCYPVLLDDPSGKCTEFEADMHHLHDSLISMGVGCIELIPGRNDHDILERFVNFFYSRGFVVTFGTEHNSPDMIPLTVKARGDKMLSENLMLKGWKGACVIAAHQYQRSKGGRGYTDSVGRTRSEERTAFEKTGQLIIEHYLRRNVK